jgi:hypothetical protein
MQGILRDVFLSVAYVSRIDLLVREQEWSRLQLKIRPLSASFLKLAGFETTKHRKAFDILVPFLFVNLKPSLFK